jgi:hypothetical protein
MPPLKLKTSHDRNPASIAGVQRKHLTIKGQNLPCAAGPRAAAPGASGFFSSPGRNAAKRAQKFCGTATAFAFIKNAQP